jgi:hypothetical protein
MRIDKAIAKLIKAKENGINNLCARSVDDVNKGKYCIYYGEDSPLMFASRKDDIIIPEISLYKHIYRTCFNIVKMDNIDMRYIYKGFAIYKAYNMYIVDVDEMPMSEIGIKS